MYKVDATMGSQLPSPEHSPFLSLFPVSFSFCLVIHLNGTSLFMFSDLRRGFLSRCLIQLIS